MRNDDLYLAMARRNDIERILRHADRDALKTVLIILGVTALCTAVALCIVNAI